MRRSTFILAVIMGWVLVSGAFFQSSAKKKEPEGGFPVTVTLGYSESREAGDAIQSDDGTTYGDVASINRHGNFWFTIGGKQKPRGPLGRKLWLDFSGNCIAGCPDDDLFFVSPSDDFGLFVDEPGVVGVRTRSKLSCQSGPDLFCLSKSTESLIWLLLSPGWLTRAFAWPKVSTLRYRIM